MAKEGEKSLSLLRFTYNVHKAFSLIHSMKKNIKLDILAFGAHPDDVEAGCSGLLIKSAFQGKKIGIVDLSLAELSTNGTVLLRMKEAERAAKIIGASVRENLEFPNNFFVNSKKAQEKIITVVRKYRPETVLLPYWNDRHPDHMDTSKIVLPALFTAGLVKFKNEYPRHRPSQVFFYRLWHAFNPSFIVDISKEFPQKLEAMLAYRSQFIKNKNSLPTKDNKVDFLEYIKARHRVDGYEIGVAYGEVYLSNTPLGIKNTASLMSNYD